jgi:hypothetical protein
VYVGGHLDYAVLVRHTNVMGLLRKLFGKRNSGDRQSATSSMGQQQFWEIIAQARDSAENAHVGRGAALYDELRRLPASEVRAFQSVFDEAIKGAYRWDLWGAARIMTGYNSDDGFIYFLNWLISEGKEVYEAALADPDSLAMVSASGDKEDEEFGYAALQAYEELGAGDLGRDFSIELLMPSGEKWHEETLPTLLPRLAALYAFEVR